MWTLFRQLLLFITLSLILTPLAADAMQDRRVTISATLFPRIISVDNNLSKKYDELGNIRFGLIYVSEKSKAVSISQTMTRKIKKIRKHLIVFDYIRIDQLHLLNDKKIGGIFLVEPISDQDLARVHTLSTEKNVLYFSPFEGDMERGAMASIFVGSKIQPYFNIASLKHANVNLKAALIKVSKLYE